MVDFISAPVISGFCSAAALTGKIKISKISSENLIELYIINVIVASTQAKSLFGLKFEGSSFIEIWTGVFTHLDKIRAADAGLGVGAIVVLLLMRKMTLLKSTPCLKECVCMQQRWVDRVLWFTATSRNAIAVISGCLTTYLLKQNGLQPFSLTGQRPNHCEF